MCHIIRSSVSQLFTAYNTTCVSSPIYTFHRVYTQQYTLLCAHSPVFTLPMCTLPQVYIPRCVYFTMYISRHLPMCVCSVISLCVYDFSCLSVCMSPPYIASIMCIYIFYCVYILLCVYSNVVQLNCPHVFGINHIYKNNISSFYSIMKNKSLFWLHK